MNPNVLTAAISAAAAVITALVALVLNYRGFATIKSRFSTTENRITAMANRLSHDLREVRADLKQFFHFQVRADLAKRLGRIEDKTRHPAARSTQPSAPPLID